MTRFAIKFWALLVAASVSAAAAGQDSWTHRGRTAARNGIIAGVAPDISEPRFVTADSRLLIGQSAPVVAGGLVFVYAENEAGDGNDLLAFRESDGGLAWSQPVEPSESEYDSRSSPTVDLARGHVLIGSGTTVTALDMTTGDVVWETALGARPIVNSSITVYGTQAFIVDYSPFATGTLYAINLDPAHPTLGAGDVAWTANLAKSLGNEAAVDAATGALVVTDFAGYLRRFTLSGSAGWTFAVPGAGTPVPTYGSFAGGPAIEGGRVYAATYNFSGGQDNSRLYCIDLAGGGKVWDAPCERTDSTPIITPGAPGLVILSGGINGYGSAPKVEAYDKATGAKSWQWTGGGLWTTQPVVVGTTLYVGGNSEYDDYLPCTDFYALDLTKTPSDAGFAKGHFVGAGSSPAYANGSLYTIGAAGLHAFGPGPIGITVTVSHDGWAYQNTPVTTQWRHVCQLGVSIDDDPNGNSSYVVSVTANAASAGAALIESTADPLAWNIRGGQAGLQPAGEVILDVTVTGLEHGGSGAAQAAVTVRLIGDIDGDGDVDANDKASMNRRLNSLTTPYGDRCYDLTGNGVVDANDKAVMNRVLNSLSIQ